MYMDESGNLIFAESASQVPEKYRTQVIPSTPAPTDPKEVTRLRKKYEKEQKAKQKKEEKEQKHKEKEKKLLEEKKKKELLKEQRKRQKRKEKGKPVEEIT